ncbi:MAG: transglycosylase SLT domain-containing protein [Rubrivivax sp.]|nr:transglycosylase SLT domain-containing protein [Rubrivivax sp.]
MTLTFAAHRGPAHRAAAAASAALLLALLLSGCASLPTPGDNEPAPVVNTPVALPEAAPTPIVAAPASAPASATLTADALPTPPRGRLDPSQDAVRSDLWARVREGFSMSDLDGALVRKWEQWYARDPAYVERMTERGGRYLFHIVEEVQRRGMPAELALLPFIESAFNPQAMSRAAASGMWQFMPATGKDYELRQNLFRDDRRDVLASTRAALDYLQRLHGLFDDWHLALAAYNWGQGNVARAIERNRRAGLPVNYEALRMPLETREYVPKLQAVKNIVLQPEAFALRLQPLENHPYFLSVPIERDIDVGLAAALAGLSLDQFQQLNPQMNKPVILAAGTPQVLLPYDNANRFLRQLAEHPGPLASWTAWVAPRTLQPAEAARLIGMSEGELREVNQIPPRMLVQAGSTLLVPRDEQSDADVAEHIADHARLVLSPEARPLRTVRFKAGRRGDSVAAVARRYRVSRIDVAQWNGVTAQAQFRAGQSIVVKLQAQPTARKVARRQAAPPPRQASKPAASPTRAAARKTGPARRAQASGGASPGPARAPAR